MNIWDFLIALENIVNRYVYIDLNSNLWKQDIKKTLDK